MSIHDSPNAKLISSDWVKRYWGLFTATNASQQNAPAVFTDWSSSVGQVPALGPPFSWMVSQANKKYQTMLELPRLPKANLLTFWFPHFGPFLVMAPKGDQLLFRPLGNSAPVPILNEASLPTSPGRSHPSGSLDPFRGWMGWISVLNPLVKLSLLAF